MTKKELIVAVENAKTETKNALQTVYNALNQGQQKKIVKNEAVKALFLLRCLRQRGLVTDGI